MLTRACLGLALTAATAASAAGYQADSQLAFVDVRLQGGLHAMQGYGAALTLMCGDIGTKEQHVVDTWSDAGIVLGLRALANHVDAKLDAGPDYEAHLIGGAIVGGIGFYLGGEDHLEVVIGYGRGRAADGTSSSFDKAGSFATYLAEIGWYRTWDAWQLGGNIGWSIDSLKLDSPAGGAIFKAKAQGVDAAFSIGYRF